MDALHIGEGSAVADLGAGGGWFTVRLARRVGPNGRGLRGRHPAADDRGHRSGACSAKACSNVKTVLGTAPDPKLPEGTLDAALFVDTYHEIEQPITLLRNVATALKPTGLIGIVEFTKDGGGPGPAMDERIDAERVIARRRSRGPAAGARARRSSAISTCSCSACRVDDDGLPAFFADVSRSRVGGNSDGWSTVRRAGRARDGVHRIGAVQAGARSADHALRRTVRRHRRAGGAGSRGDRARARRIPDPRRSAGDGRRAAAERTAANHLAFGESIAILAAFGLLNLAYGTLAASLRARLGGSSRDR